MEEEDDDDDDDNNDDNDGNNNCGHNTHDRKVYRQIPDGLLFVITMIS